MNATAERRSRDTSAAPTLNQTEDQEAALESSATPAAEEQEPPRDNAAAETGNANAAGEAEKDAFEVDWDGGDSDPLCPRSFSKARKWLITFIVSHVSLCV